MNYRPGTTETMVRMGTLAVEGLNIFPAKLASPATPSSSCCTASRRRRINTAISFRHWPTHST
jgi:hypothetical protein